MGNLLDNVSRPEYPYCPNYWCSDCNHSRVQCHNLVFCLRRHDDRYVCKHTPGVYKVIYFEPDKTLNARCLYVCSESCGSAIACRMCPSPKLDAKKPQHQFHLGVRCQMCTEMCCPYDQLDVHVPVFLCKQNKCYDAWLHSVTCVVCHELGKPIENQCTVCHRRYCLGCFPWYVARSTKRLSPHHNVGQCLGDCFAHKMARTKSCRKKRALQCARRVTMEKWQDLLHQSLPRTVFLSRDLRNVVILYVVDNDHIPAADRLNLARSRRSPTVNTVPCDLADDCTVVF